MIPSRSHPSDSRGSFQLSAALATLLVLFMIMAMLDAARLILATAATAVAAAEVQRCYRAVESECHHGDAVATARLIASRVVARVLPGAELGCERPGCLTITGDRAGEEGGALPELVLRYRLSRLLS